MPSRTMVLLNSDLHRKLKELAARKGLTMGAIADEYVAAGIAKDEKRKTRVA